MGEALEYVADGYLSQPSIWWRGHIDGLLNTGATPRSRRRAGSPGNNERLRRPVRHSATAVITTKSGTNSLHGSLFETARNNGWGIAKSRHNPAAYAVPKYIRNEFGVSAGGPIELPHIYHGKDKSFWFFAYERYSLSQSYYTLTKVPTNAMRNGDFSQARNSSNILPTLYDPATTQPSANCNGRCRQPVVSHPVSQ